MRLLAAVTLAQAVTSVAAQEDGTLIPFALAPLPLGSIKANGWLGNEIGLSANGLAGRQHEFYRVITESRWIGGDYDYSKLNEGFSYWFNGLVPLAYTADDQRLKDAVHSNAQKALDLQAEDGWIGPEVGPARNFWGRFPFLLGLMNLADANSTWEEPVVNALGKFTTLMNEMLKDGYRGYQEQPDDDFPEGDYQWGRVRYPDMMITLQWLYEKHPNGQEQIIMDNMNFLNNGSLDWTAWYNEAEYIKEDFTKIPFDDGNNPRFGYHHGVNVAQGLKASAVVRRFTYNESLLQTAKDSVDWTFKYHGSASRSVIADERLEGLSPYSGSELCTAVEMMYSLTYMYQAIGDPYYADNAEITSYNALPTMLTSDHWGHQYMAQPNQPYANKLRNTPFWNVGPLGTTFGLEPAYPCCTVNHPQGLPKYVMAMYAKVGDNGLAHAHLGPAKVTTSLGSGAVTVDCQTDYPFGGTLTYTVDAEGDFDLYVRVPGWAKADGSSIQVGDGEASPLAPGDNGLQKVSLPAGQSTVKYTIGSEIRTEARANDTIAVFNGALLYALEIPNTNTSAPPLNYNNGDPYPNPPPESRDWQYNNESAWNFAVDPASFAYKTAEPGELPAQIWAAGAPPGWIEAKACQIDWPLFLDAVPGAVPAADVRKCIEGTNKDVKLVPYGSARARMSELPTISIP